MDIRISTAGSVTHQEVSLNGEHVGTAQWRQRNRAPKKWTALLGTGEMHERQELGRFPGASEAVFAVALAAHNANLREAILAQVGGQS